MSNLPPSPSEHGCSTHCCDSQDCCPASCRCVCYTSHTVQTRLLGSARRSCVSPVMSACHRYYADIIIGLLQDVALQAALHPYEELDASHFQTPPPMYDNNLESTTTCLRGDLLQQRVYQAVVCFPPIHGCLSVYPSVCLSVRPSVCLSAWQSGSIYVCFAVCLNVWMSPPWLATMPVPEAANVECMVECMAELLGLYLSCICHHIFT